MVCGYHRRKRTQADPLAGRRDRMRIGVIVGRTHSGRHIAALDGRVTAVAARSHLVARQADKCSVPPRQVFDGAMGASMDIATSTQGASPPNPPVYFRKKCVEVGEG